MFRLVFLLFSLAAAIGEAFMATTNPGGRTRSTPPATPIHSCTQRRHMAPKYDGSKWIATVPNEDGPQAGYPPTKTLLLHGPRPYLTRLFQPDDYEQAVLKFMASDKVSRVEAQGNMDAYLRNPNDWQFNRMEEQTRGIKYDYWTLETPELIKTAVWSVIVLAIVGRAVYSFATGVDFYDLGVGPFVGNR